MKIFIIGTNYNPEPTGIAVYTTGLATELQVRGHEVTAICAPPHFPGWRILPGYSSLTFRRELIDGVMVVRCPIYVPSKTDAIRRILHYGSFAISSLFALLSAMRRGRPDLVFVVAPSLLSAPPALLIARLAGSPAWLHVQDFEVEAAFATGVMDSDRPVARLARWFEARALRCFDHVSTISAQMKAKLVQKGVPENRASELRNWADLEFVTGAKTSSAYRDAWGIRAPHVALYSGSIGNKQGLEIVIEAARELHDRRDLEFVICGEGPNRPRLEALAQGLSNIQFRDLQPKERLGELMSLATMHLLPQIADAADLVLPSKLTNMLASGRPVVATAAPGSGLYDAVSGCGIATPPGDVRAFAGAISLLADDPAAGEALGRAARAKAEAELAASAIIERVEAEMRKLVQAHR